MRILFFYYFPDGWNETALTGTGRSDFDKSPEKAQSAKEEEEAGPK